MRTTGARLESCALLRAGRLQPARTPQNRSTEEARQRRVVTTGFYPCYHLPMADVRITVDGKPVVANSGENLLEIVRGAGCEVPSLCYLPKLGYRAAGNCRSCMVEIKGERVLAASCIRTATEGMVVETQSARAAGARRTVLELLMADQPPAARHRDSELHRWSAHAHVPAPRFPGRAHVPETDASHPAIAVNMDACILCTRCVRACRDVQVNDVIGLAGRGHSAKIVFDLDDPMGESTCVGCGECVQACPTGALVPSNGAYLAKPDKFVDSVCPYCGVGCQVTYAVKDGHILGVDGREGPANEGRLCVKGRYGFDYAHHPDRLTKPLIRKEGVGKKWDDTVDPRNPSTHFREATWDEALDRAATGLVKLRDARGPASLAGFGSAKCSNEEAYLFQKLVRVGFRTNNVDHCTRLCHASSVAALFEGLASAAVSNPFNDAVHSDVIVVIGANPTVNHPVAATFMKNAVKRGATLIVMDPRGQALTRHATHMLQFTSGADVALLNSIMNVIVTEKLQDERFIAAHTTGFDEMLAHLPTFTPEAMEPLTGIEPAAVRAVARAYARAKNAIIFWGMGISQHTHGTDNARCLIAMSLMTGQIGRPGTGLHPLRGQNNVQGASDAGLVPMFYPGYQRVEDPAVRAAFEKSWGVALDPKRGLTVVEIMDAIHAGTVRGMYIQGENPAMSDPNLRHARSSIAKLEHLVVQDVFLTETAFHADVILPASAWPEKDGTVTNTNRQVQLGRKVLDAPGDAKPDWWITREIARRMGMAAPYDHPREIYEEMRAVMPPGVLTGAPWERLERESSVTYPVERVDAPGADVIFTPDFPTADGRARFIPAGILPPNEQPDAEFPMVLTTGRLLEHWHTGSMTRRASVLDEIEPEAVAHLSPYDLERLGIRAGDRIRVSSRRGEVELFSRLDSGTPHGVVFIPFCFHEAAANLLTNPALDPFGKIPEFKYCAAKVEAA